MPEIDYLFITHDHYDHLDHKTVKALRGKVRTVITGMGTGGHLERWGYDSNKIIEKDWNEEEILADGFKITTAPARHFSGRTFKRNGNIWLSFILTTPNRKIYIGGDSGYDTHFAAIGEAYGPFDLVLLENGQYDKHWKYIHMQPEEVVQAATDLKAKKLFAIHWGKFALSKHPWDEPIIRTSTEAALKGMPLIHPMIGEVVHLDEEKVYSKWWEQIG
jgi:L-ascorbate metabolism protein UlaG (beta-lactamase superfamily)